MRVNYEIVNYEREISNESHKGSVDWQYHMIRLIQDYEKDKPKQHLVGMTGAPIDNPELDLEGQYPFFFDLPSLEMTMSIWCKVNRADLPADKELQALWRCKKLSRNFQSFQINATCRNFGNTPF